MGYRLESSLGEIHPAIPWAMTPDKSPSYSFFSLGDVRVVLEGRAIDNTKRSELKKIDVGRAHSNAAVAEGMGGIKCTKFYKAVLLLLLQTLRHCDASRDIVYRSTAERLCGLYNVFEGSSHGGLAKYCCKCPPPLVLLGECEFGHPESTKCGIPENEEKTTASLGGKPRDSTTVETEQEYTNVGELTMEAVATPTDSVTRREVTDGETPEGSDARILETQAKQNVPIRFPAQTLIELFVTIVAAILFSSIVKHFFVHVQIYICCPCRNSQAAEVRHCEGENLIETSQDDSKLHGITIPEDEQTMNQPDEKGKPRGFTILRQRSLVSPSSSEQK